MIQQRFDTKHSKMLFHCIIRFFFFVSLLTGAVCLHECLCVDSTTWHTTVTIDFFRSFFAAILRISDHFGAAANWAAFHRLSDSLGKKLTSDNMRWDVSMSNGLLVSWTLFFNAKLYSLVTKCVPCGSKVHFRAHICMKLTSFAFRFANGKLFHSFFFPALWKDFSSLFLRAFHNVFTWISIRLWSSSC